MDEQILKAYGYLTADEKSIVDGMVVGLYERGLVIRNLRTECARQLARAERLDLELQQLRSSWDRRA